MNTLVTARSLELCSRRATPIRVGAVFSSLRQLLRTWVERDRARRELRNLDDHTLRDVGPR